MDDGSLARTASPEVQDAKVLSSVAGTGAAAEQLEAALQVLEAIGARNEVAKAL